MATSSSSPMFQLGDTRYTLNTRIGRLVNIANALQTIRLQDLDEHLMHLMRQDQPRLTEQCLTLAAAIDKALLRPVGTTTGPLYAYLGSRPGLPPLPPVPTPREMRALREREFEDRKQSRTQLRRLVANQDRSR